MKPTVGAALIAVVRRSNGLAGGAAGSAPRPPRPARPARPAAGAVLVGRGAGADNAVSSGARSPSVDHRSNSIVSGAVGALAPITLALSVNAELSARTAATLTMPAVAATI